MEPEKSLLVGVEFPGDSWPFSESMEELSLLAKTAGATVVDILTQKREKPDLKSFIGKGKLEELYGMVKQSGINLVIFDNELHPSQQRNLEDHLGVKVVDRTELILDIFAQHAHSHEGRLQVELAQSEFMLTRLSGKGVSMSRLGGGIGTRGPGETKLEQDRRKIRKKISQLKQEIENIRKSRSVRRETRKSSGIGTASLIGYTNAGKSTLMNSLTRSEVHVEDKLFATLDTTTRRLYLPEGKTILLSDTVGFIQKLPHQLIDAFKATLEEVKEADLLIHVVDSNSKNLEEQINAVYVVLEDIGAINKPIITTFNKTDLIAKKIPKILREKFNPSFEVSALKKTGLEELKESIASFLRP